MYNFTITNTILHNYSTGSLSLSTFLLTEAVTLQDFGSISVFVFLDWNLLKTSSYIQQLDQSSILPERSIPYDPETHIANNNQVYQQTIPSRVLKDAFHLMSMLPTPPGELYPAVKFLFDTYGPLPCAKTGFPLFDQESIKISKNILRSIELGHVSDIVNGPPLYREIGKDKNGLMKYACFRGTSSVEGYHQTIINKFSSVNVGPRLADSILADFRLYHNIEVGSRNREGIIHKSHYSPWIAQSINMMRLYIGHTPLKNYNTYHIEKLPVDFACQSVENFGITVLSLPYLKTYDMKENPNLNENTQNLPIEIVKKKVT